MKKEVMKVFETYTEGLSKGNLEVVFATMSDDIVWHMGGESSLSGTVRGKEALGERLGEFNERSDGTFRVITNWRQATIVLLLPASFLWLKEMEKNYMIRALICSE